MKKSLLIIFTWVIGAMTHQIFAQNINIPDINFKNALIAAGVDKNGDGEIQESEAESVKKIAVNRKNISSLEGIEKFINLEDLECYNNKLTNLNLQNLTKLTSITASSNSLLSINLSNSNSLKRISIGENQLTNFNLDNLTNLELLHIRNNPLDALDLSKTPKLKSLDCLGINVTNFDFSYTPLLDSLVFGMADITQLDVSSLTELKFLAFTQTKIKKLDLSNNSKIEVLQLNYNELENLDISKLVNLKFLLCEHNNIKSIDISNIKNIELFHISNNPIEVINLKNGALNILTSYGGMGFSLPSLKIFENVPNLIYICVDSLELDSLKQVALYYDYGHILINSYCNGSSSGASYTLNGQIKLDLDQNGCEDTDDAFPFVKIKVSNSSDNGYLIASSQGNFSIGLQEETNTLEPVLDHPDYFSVNPTSSTYTLPDTISPSFCITPKGNFNDLAVSIIPVRAARPGFSDAQYKIVYKNQGTTTQSGNVTFHFDDDKMDIISSSPIADVSNAGQLGFDFTNLAPFESKSILVTMRTNAPTDNPAVNVDDVLSFSAAITAQTDETPDDNTSILYQTVVGSFDPNDKTCLEGDIITPDMVGKRVNYLIRFENTGTAPAENVVVTDYIDTSVFEVSSLLVTDASHTCHTQISNGNKVQFIFSDIQLPFTEPDKHGYVAFSILLKDDLQIGDSIKNYADIYFDYNLPITTNEAISEVKNRVITSVKQRISDIQLAVYPNPSKGNFSVELKSNTNAPVVINVIDIKGKVVFAKQYTAQQGLIPIQLEKLAKGTYLIQAQQENYIVSRKVVVQ